MLRRFFRSPSSAATSLPTQYSSSASHYPSASDQLTREQPIADQPTSGCTNSGSTKMSMPQPIGDADKQRFVKLSDAQGKTQEKVYISDWYDGHLSIPQNRRRTLAASQSLLTAKKRQQPQPIAEYGEVTPPRIEPLEDAPLGLHKRADAHLERMDATQVEAASEMRAAKQKINQLTHYIQRQQRLHLVERKLRRTLNFETIIGTTVVETADLFDAEQVSLLRYDGTTQTYQPTVRYCQNQALAWKPQLSLSQAEFPNLLKQLWQGQVIHISADAMGDLAANEQCQWLTRWPGNWLIMPVRKGVQVSDLADLSSINTATTDATSYWGLMALSLPASVGWTHEDVAIIHSITVELALALQQSKQHEELKIANQELQKLALSDGLTSLANRRRFDEHLADEWQRLAREKQPLSLILCDLDHFKRYNDTFGHPAGDRCLIRVARALLNGPQRPADLVARYGGEEFAIILPNTDTHGAWRIAQKIHESIRALQIDHAPGNKEPYVTVTMGVSTVIPGHENSAQMLVQASDLALYHAKQQGRNRTYVNGHYNTVNTQASESAVADEAELDVMLLDG